MGERLYKDEKIVDWNFIENAKIDVLQESARSDKSAKWTCCKCGTKHTKKIKEYRLDNVCPCKRKFTSLKSGEKEFKIKYFLKSLLSASVMSFLGCLIKEMTFVFKPVSVSQVVAFIFILGLFFTTAIGLYQLMENYIVRDKKLQKIKSDIYYLMQTPKDKTQKETIFYENIKMILLSMLTSEFEELEEYTFEYKFNKYKAKSFKCYLKDKTEYKEFKHLLKIFKNKGEFNQIYSQVESCNLINFTPPYKKHNLILSFILSIINLVGAFISSENFLLSWQEFICIGIIIGYAVVFVFIIRNKIKLERDNYFEKLILISSMNAKILKTNENDLTLD